MKKIIVGDQILSKKFGVGYVISLEKKAAICYFYSAGYQPLLIKHVRHLTKLEFWQDLAKRIVIVNQNL